MMRVSEVALTEQLVKRFPFLDGKIRAPRARRIFIDDITDKFDEVFKYAISELEFTILCTISGMDELERIAFAYHIARPDGTILTIRKSAPKNDPVINTITGTFFGADIYERELVDLLGVKVKGLKEGKRYPLPDDWPEGEYPLRKDWKKSSSKEEVKTGGQT
jgi:Ni,Fe-hydrogenase III component G